MNDSFLVHDGIEGGLVFVYSSARFPGKGAERYLTRLHYPHFLAFGAILHPTKEWKFLRPLDDDGCEQLIRKMVFDDDRILEFYAEYKVRLPSTLIVGQMGKFLTN